MNLKELQAEDPTEAQISAALQAGGWFDTPQSRKDVRRALLAAAGRLLDELSRIQKSRQQIESEERYLKNKLILDNKDMLLKLIDHGRTSCSDQDISNGFYSAEYGPRCARCALLELGEYNLDVYEIGVDVSFTHPSR